MESLLKAFEEMLRKIIREEVTLVLEAEDSTDLTEDRVKEIVEAVVGEQETEFDDRVKEVVRDMTFEVSVNRY